MKLSDEDKTILYRFFSKKPIKRAFLFGSFARGEADTQSDIDILVELDHSKSIGMKFFGFQSELEELLKKKVDLVSANGVSPFIKPYIDKDMTLIYERQSN